MKIALIVGINHYQNISRLFGCVNDANNVKSILERNSGGSVNFHCKLLTASSNEDSISRGNLKDSIETLFKTEAEIALFYFAGHGHIEDAGGYLLASDSSRGDEGVSLSEILIYANSSPAMNKIIILDSCHSGFAGSTSSLDQLSTLSEGLTILTASTKEQYASEENGSGIFTNLFVDALKGGAANLLGDVSPGSIYAHIDQSLGWWEQRPLFKANVKRFVSLRKAPASIILEDLRQISIHFPHPDYEFGLDPTYEKQMKGRDEGMPLPNKENTKVFTVLQRYNRLNLLIPIDTPNMWDAAMESKSCRLTSLGKHYWKLVKKERI